jgi:hypothetical protein
MQKFLIECVVLVTLLVLRIGTAVLKPVGWFLAALHAAEDRRAAAEEDRLRAVHNPSVGEEESSDSSWRGVLGLLLLLLLPSFLAGLMEGE